MTFIEVHGVKDPDDAVKELQTSYPKAELVEMSRRAKS